MVTNSRDIWEKCKKDDALQRKVSFLQQVMFSNTFGLCDQEYWNLSRNGNLPVDFFKKRKAHLLSLDFNKFQQELKLNNWRNYIFISDENSRTDEEVFHLFRKNLTEMNI